MPAFGDQQPALVAAQARLSAGEAIERSNPSGALGSYLASAQAALAELGRHPEEKAARDVYNFSVARSVGVIEEAKLKPWDRTLVAPAPEGQYSLTGVRPQNPDRNPANFELIPADSLVVGGSYLKKRVTTEGIGAPVVAIGRKPRTDARARFTSDHIYADATGIVRFNGRQAQLEFFESLGTNRVSLGGHSYPLAADYTATTAVGLTRERPEKLGLIRMLRPEKYHGTARLTRLQGYDRDRIPVIFIHGLQDTPASWVPMLNTLRDDPEIRRRYQFWVYSYPSGYPFFYSAALLREELDAVRRAYPDHKNVVLIGHSMGGLLSRLMVTDAGEKLWIDYFGKRPVETNLPADIRAKIEPSLIFNHRADVSRVIFISTPHRGSSMAANWIGRLATGLIKMPFLLASVPFQAIDAAVINDPGSPRLKRIPNSIDTLSPHNRFVRELNELPVTAGIPYHSIIGDRGRGDTPQSSDGVVPYWSSHLAGAQSELIVPSNHSAPANPQAIAEVERILKAN
ncbi:MAG: esterase/lipase family protein [Chthoniobacterales bacterium]